MKVENFSGGYLRAKMKIVPYEDGPVMESETFEFINRQFYSRSDGFPIFRLGLNGNPYFEVDTEFSIPADKIGIPREWFGDNKISDDDEFKDVYILKPAHADILREATTLSKRFGGGDE